MNGHVFIHSLCTLSPLFGTFFVHCPTVAHSDTKDPTGCLPKSTISKNPQLFATPSYFHHSYHLASIFSFVYFHLFSAPTPTHPVTSESLRPRTLPGSHPANIYYKKKNRTVSVPSGKHYTNYMLMAESKTQLFPTASQSPLHRCSANVATRRMLNKRLKYDYYYC